MTWSILPEAGELSTLVGAFDEPAVLIGLVLLLLLLLLGLTACMLWRSIRRTKRLRTAHAELHHRFKQLRQAYERELLANLGNRQTQSDCTLQPGQNSETSHQDIIEDPSETASSKIPAITRFKR